MKDSFWSVLTNPNSIKPIDENDFLMVEQKYNVKLPESYKTLLRDQNGGYINYSILPDWKDNIEVRAISGIRGGKSDIIEESDYYINEWDLPENILLISGEGHWWICFDYRNNKEGVEPKITYLDSEYNLDVVVAENFVEFIQLLKKLEEVDFED